MSHPLIRKLSSFTRLSIAERDELSGLLNNAVGFQCGGDLINNGQRRPGSVMLLESGWAIHYRLLADGRRQILSFLVPGDFVEPNLFAGAHPLCSVTAITQASAVAVRLDGLLRLASRHQAIRKALLSEWAYDLSLWQARLVAVGRQSAYEGIAYLVLELWWRLQRVGMATQQTFEIPVTQTMISDALALSIVHTSRTMNRLKRDHVREFRGRQVHICNVHRLQMIAEADRL